MDLTTQTPREIDEQIGAAYRDMLTAQGKVDAAFDSLHYRAGDRKVYRGRSRQGVWTMTNEEAETKVREALAAGTLKPWDVDTYEQALIRLGQAQDAVEEANGRILIGETEFTRRGGWTRFFLVTSSAGGHIHSSMACSTCRITTTYGWMPEFSGQSETEALATLAEGGSILCSVCFPSAPVEWTRKREDDTKCPGSGTYDYPRETARLGYYSGNYGICSHCDQHATVTSTGKMRKHKPAA